MDIDPRVAELYREEIEELTDLLRNDASWEDLRRILRNNGFDLETSLLVACIEGEEEDKEWGVLVTNDKRVIEYERRTTIQQNNDASFVATDITHQPKRLADYPSVFVALAQIS